MTPSEEIAIIKWTVLLEAAGEPYTGKLAVAFVIANRMQKRGQNAFDVCWAPYQFSCWLDSLQTVARKLDREAGSVAAECGKAAEQAYHRYVADPTDGADHYLNKELTIKQAGKLPSWVEKLTPTVTIGRHSFFK